MIWFDVTKSDGAGHQSGLMRVNTRLRAELGEAAKPVSGLDWRGHAAPGDWFLTAEVFSPDERPGWAELAARRPCRLAAIYHDAIPLKLPRITWPQSVRRHPAYLKMLAGFDRVWAISEASRAELLGYWAWLGIPTPPPVEVLALGADFDGRPRQAQAAVSGPPLLLSVGIVEPRKNQEFLLTVCDRLWAEGLQFDLHLVGRINPRFGRPIAAQIRRMGRRRPGLHFHGAAEDAALGGLYARATAAVFPTRAEGCGLPLLEALWRGVPCVASDLPALRENAAGGGCRLVEPDNLEAWMGALKGVLTDAGWREQLGREASSRELPTWAGTARVLRAALAG